MSAGVDQLVQAAHAAASQGRWADAERLWQQVLTLDPRQPQALFSAGVHAFQRGRLAEARQYLQQAALARPGEPAILSALATVLRELGDTEAEQQAIEAALAADPYFLPALVARAHWLERAGRYRAATDAYRNALAAAPPEAHWPPALRPQLEHGRALVDEQAQQFMRYLVDRLDLGQRDLSRAERERWFEASSLYAGASRPYPSVCNRLQIPRLPAIPFFERKDFPWVEALEAQTDAIIEEMQGVWRDDAAEFRPYIAHAQGTPLNQWRELNHSQRWSSYFLWRNGEPQPEHQSRCPQTTRALQAVDMADIGGLCPNAMFSALAPRTHIPPHHGETNARLVVHLPLVVPDGCRYRVGFEHRRWHVGETLIFDDSIEHEARNDSDELRVVLIFDVWNPLLSPGERDLVREISAAARDFRFQPGATP